MTSSDPRVLPIVYDYPVCDSITNTSLLDCPRATRVFGDFGDVVVFGGLGRLLENTVGSPAQTFVVGVNCEGK